MTAQTKRRFLRIVGYLAFFVAVYVVALLVTFPYNRLTGFAERQAGTALGRTVTIAKLRPTITGALRMENVTLGPKRGGPAPASTEPEIPALQIERATVRVGLLGMIFGRTSVSFDALIADGNVSGRFWQNAEESGLELELEELRAQRLQALRDKVGLPIKGTISGEVSFTVPAGKANESVGDVKLALSGFVIGDGEAKLSINRLTGYGRGQPAAEDEEGGLDLPPIRIGPVTIESTVSGGVAELPRVEAVSEDAELSFEGRVKLREPLGQSRVDTYLTLKLTEGYIERDENIESIMQVVNVQARQAKRDDGSFGFRLSGTLAAGVTMRPSKTFASAGERGAPRAGSRRRGASRRRPSPPSKSPISRARRGATPPGSGAAPGEAAEERQVPEPGGLSRSIPRPPIGRIPRLQPRGDDEETTVDEETVEEHVEDEVDEEEEAEEEAEAHTETTPDEE